MVTWDSSILWADDVGWALGIGDLQGASDVIPIIDAGGSVSVLYALLGVSDARPSLDAGGAIVINTTTPPTAPFPAGLRAVVPYTGVRAIVPPEGSQTMAIIKEFVKQPADVEVYEIDYAAKYLAGTGDVATNLLALSSDAGITVTPEVAVGGAVPGGVVRVRVSGGMPGRAYKITARLGTVGGREKEAEILVNVVES